MRRSSIKIMAQLIGLVKPLIHIMIAAVLLGVAGFICAIGVTVLPAFAIADVLGYEYIEWKIAIVLIIVAAVLRGLLHYGEQACNHYIAFKLLALIRHKVFTALRKLAPAKMEGKKKGELIAVLTSDIELLEVFYAHTISPIAIALLTSAIMLAVLSTFGMVPVVVAAMGYICVGVIIPLVVGKKGAWTGMSYRNDFAELNSVVFDNLRGIDEILQYDYGKESYDRIKEDEVKLNGSSKKLKLLEGRQKAITGFAIMLFTFIMLLTCFALYKNGIMGIDETLISTVIMTASFGPVTALSNLSNNLTQTLAAGERVLSVLEEEPQVYDVTDKEIAEFGEVTVDNLSFGYDEEKILQDINFSFEKGKITGILGKSGCGKSTLLKLLMRFWEAESGSITIKERNLNDINTNHLRDMQSYVTQETWIFNDTIKENIAVAKPKASLEEIKKAAEKAGLGGFIANLPKGYDTVTGELGEGLSGGERQRIGIARAFLHNSPMMLLDEPTSNLDALHESYIMDSLASAAEEKTVILVSHRESTMGIADKVFEMKRERSS